MDFISNYVDCTRTDKTKFNIIGSGTGTGKTYWVANDLLKEFPNVRKHEIIFVTSRSMIVEQQKKSDNIDKYNPHNLIYLNQWNGNKDLDYCLKEKGIQIMTYDKIIDIILERNMENLVTLQNVKIIIFDECHTMFSDKFIRDVEALKVWIRDTLYTNTKIIIGMTATPSILEFCQKQWGISTNRLNDNILINYKAKQLHCTDFDTIPYIITTNQIQGKTIIMCYSVSDCYKLKEKIPNSAVLISKSSENYLPEMDLLRNYIIENESLPDTYWEVYERDSKTKEPTKYDELHLEVLITTSTLREGVNLRAESGVKNVISCFSDELHITQFAGRCRFPLDNLIVADTYIRTDNYHKFSYLEMCRNNFKEFMKNKNNTKWFDSISHLVDHDVYKTIRFILGTEEKRFINYINTKWLVPEGLQIKEQLDKYKIYKEEDKQEILKKFIECKLLTLHHSLITFNKVISTMTDTLGYSIQNGRMRIDGKQPTYKLIIDFDEEKVTYMPPKNKYEM